MRLDEVPIGPPESFSMLERAVWHVLEDDYPRDVQEACLATLEQAEGAVWNQ